MRVALDRKNQSCKHFVSHSILLDFFSHKIMTQSTCDYILFLFSHYLRSALLAAVQGGFHSKSILTMVRTFFIVVQFSTSLLEFLNFVTGRKVPNKIT